MHTEGKTSITFFVAFSLSFLHPALRHVQVVSLIVSCLCYEAIHGGEVHQKLLKAEHCLRRDANSLFLGENLGEL